MDGKNDKNNLRLTFIDSLLEDSSDETAILISGCGGGYDIYSGIPLYAALKNAGRTVIMANLTFTFSFNPSARRDERVSEMAQGCLWRVQAGAENSPEKGDRGPYFPELYLSESLPDRPPVYIIARAGVQPVMRAYEHILAAHKIGAIVLIDGGTDSLCLGNEEECGSPEEDFASIAAVHNLSCTAQKYLVSVGWGVDAFHGVSHNLVLENIAQITRSSPESNLGVVALLPTQKEFLLYKSCCDYAFKRMQTSIVAGSILNAVEGRFGDFSFTSRVAGGLFLNPLMSLMFAFRLEGLARLHLFANDPKMIATQTSSDVWDVLKAGREKMKIRKKSSFPH